MDRKDSKINAIVLYGPTNTGKSLLCKIMTDFMLTGSINRRSENTNFAFENLLDRSVAILEEPRINASNSNDMKQLLGGEAFEVAVKYKPMQYLQRLPVIITTNEYLGCRLPDVDAAALESRYFQFTFSSQIASSTVDGTIDAAPCKICTCHWAEFCAKVKESTNGNKENVPPPSLIGYVVNANPDGHRAGKHPRQEDATARDASTILPMEVLPKFWQGIYTAIFRRRFHITVPGVCNAGGKKSLLINTFAIDPFVLNIPTRLSSVHPHLRLFVTQSSCLRQGRPPPPTARDGLIGRRAWGGRASHGRRTPCALAPMSPSLWADGKISQPSSIAKGSCSTEFGLPGHLQC
ncbi:unnamed protein product [Hymenolepis diminuta]|uniref:SF3 helicase domain-containing protein n=1 Tax=Hymenolepis diminuta TaxID=6216 RepID=A0A564XUU5_HYMDI|nr:unnamed protein product [Hymenolepis diminuta]